MCNVLNLKWLCVSGLNAKVVNWIEEKPVNADKCNSTVTHEYIATTGNKIKGSGNVLDQKCNIDVINGKTSCNGLNFMAKLKIEEKFENTLISRNWIDVTLKQNSKFSFNVITNILNYRDLEHMTPTSVDTQLVSYSKNVVPQSMDKFIKNWIKIIGNDAATEFGKKTDVTL